MDRILRLFLIISTTLLLLVVATEEEEGKEPKYSIALTKEEEDEKARTLGTFIRRFFGSRPGAVEFGGFGGSGSGGYGGGGFGGAGFGGGGGSSFSGGYSGAGGGGNNYGGGSGSQYGGGGQQQFGDGGINGDDPYNPSLEGISVDSSDNGGEGGGGIYDGDDHITVVSGGARPNRPGRRPGRPNRPSPSSDFDNQEPPPLLTNQQQDAIASGASEIIDDAIDALAEAALRPTNPRPLRRPNRPNNPNNFPSEDFEQFAGISGQRPNRPNRPFPSDNFDQLGANAGQRPYRPFRPPNFNSAPSDQFINQAFVRPAIIQLPNLSPAFQFVTTTQTVTQTAYLVIDHSKPPGQSNAIDSAMPTKRLTRTRTVTKTIYPDDCTGEDNMRDMFGSLRSKLSYNDDHFKDITMSPVAVMEFTPTAPFDGPPFFVNFRRPEIEASTASYPSEDYESNYPSEDYESYSPSQDYDSAVEPHPEPEPEPESDLPEDLPKILVLDHIKDMGFVNGIYSSLVTRFTKTKTISKKPVTAEPQFPTEWKILSSPNDEEDYQ